MDPLMKAVLSSVVVAVSLYIILFRGKDREARDWAYWTVGLVLGYWLR